MTTEPRRPLAVAVALAAALLATLAIAACGDDRLSAGDYRSAVAEICSKRDAARDRAKMPQSSDQALAFVRAGLAPAARAERELADLKPPAKLSARARAALAANRHQVAALRDAVHKLEHGEDAIATLHDLSKRLSKLSARSAKAWRALGVRTCAGG